MPSGPTIALRSAALTLQICSRNAVDGQPVNNPEMGPAISRIASGETGQPQPTNGIWTKWSYRINGRKCWLWPAVDANGDVLDALVQPGRSAKAARRFLRRFI